MYDPEFGYLAQDVGHVAGLRLHTPPAIPGSSLVLVVAVSVKSGVEKVRPGCGRDHRPLLWDSVERVTVKGEDRAVRSAEPVGHRVSHL